MLYLEWNFFFFNEPKMKNALCCEIRVETKGRLVKCWMDSNQPSLWIHLCFSNVDRVRLTLGSLAPILSEIITLSFFRNLKSSIIKKKEKYTRNICKMYNIYIYS